MEHAWQTTERKPTSTGSAYRPASEAPATDREANLDERSRRERIDRSKPPFTPGETE